jgi:hypothetical protein
MLVSTCGTHRTRDAISFSYNDHLMLLSDDIYDTRGAIILSNLLHMSTGGIHGARDTITLSSHLMLSSDDIDEITYALK